LVSPQLRVTITISYHRSRLPRSSPVHCEHPVAASAGATDDCHALAIAVPGHHHHLPPPAPMPAPHHLVSPLLRRLRPQIGVPCLRRHVRHMPSPHSASHRRSRLYLHLRIAQPLPCCITAPHAAAATATTTATIAGRYALVVVVPGHRPHHPPASIPCCHRRTRATPSPHPLSHSTSTSLPPFDFVTTSLSLRHC